MSFQDLMAAKLPVPLEPPHCLKCGATFPTYECRLTVTRYIKMTITVTINQHYERSRLTLGVCAECARRLKWLLIIQHLIVLLEGAIIGSYLVYRIQRYVDPVASFELNRDSIVGYLIGVGILGSLSGALLSVICYHTLEQRWIRTTDIYKALTKDGSVGVRIGRPQRKDGGYS